MLLKNMNDRKHLVSVEVDKFIAATKGSRNEARDRCLLLLMFRQGLRVSKACGLKLSQVDTGKPHESPFSSWADEIEWNPSEKNH
jgi:integrase